MIEESVYEKYLSALLAGRRSENTKRMMNIINHLRTFSRQSEEEPNVLYLL